MSGQPQGERSAWEGRAALLAPLVGVGLLAACGAYALLSPRDVLQAYVIAFAFWWSLAVGGLALACLHQLVSGRWGLLTSRAFEATARTLPFVGLAFLPVLLNLDLVYPWFGIDAERLVNKAIWLEPTAFVARAAGYFVVWTLLAWILSGLSRRRDTHPAPGQRDRLIKLGAGGLLLFVLTTSFAAIDWFMSLEPDWYSTIYGALYVVDGAILALCVGIVVCRSRSGSAPEREFATPEMWTDLANLLLAFTMIWAYFGFSQFLIIWSADLPVESVWYLKRGAGGWLWLANLNVVLHFVVPFLLLISPDVKRSPARLTGVAGYLFVVHFAHLVWMLAPAFGPGRWALWLLAWPLWIGLGGVWTGLFLWQLDRCPVLPVNDPAADRHRRRTANGHGHGHPEPTAEARS